MEEIVLGQSGIRTSRLAFGTGTHGFRGRSEQTALGLEGLANLLRYAYDRGITFWDTADDYGAHPHVRQALQDLPREKVILLTKTQARDARRVAADVERFCAELGTDYLDIVLFHCVTERDWPQRSEGGMEALSQAQAKGRVRAVGVSCHSLAALQTAAAHPWVQVIMARVNYAGHHMDAPPQEVVPVLQQAHSAGKGMIAMKPLGQGALASDVERALRYVFGLGSVHVATIGMSSRAHVDANLAAFSSGVLGRQC